MWLFTSFVFASPTPSAWAAAERVAWVDRVLALEAAGVDPAVAGEAVDDSPLEREAKVSTVRINEEGLEEYVIYGVEAARNALERTLERLGYRQRRTVDGGVRFRSEEPYRPLVTLHPDGRVELSETAVRAKPDHFKSSTGDYATGFTVKSLGKRKMHRRRADVLDALSADIRTWRQALQVERDQQFATTLADRLDALWIRGEDLELDVVRETKEERLAAMMAFWRTRACTEAGRAVAEQVGDYLENEVLPSAVNGTDDVWKRDQRCPEETGTATLGQ